MPVDNRMQAQARLILEGHESAAAHPAADRWDDEVDNIDYLYREYAILAREQDAEQRCRCAQADPRPGWLRRRPGR